MKSVYLLLTLIILSCASATSEDSSKRNKQLDAKSEHGQDTTPTLESEIDVPVQELKREKVSFSAPDGVDISGEMVVQNPNWPTALLCHQAGFSHGEYDVTYDLFIRAGFNVLMIDQRSGKGVNGIENETAKRASDLGKPQSYLDAEQDIRSAIAFAHSMANPSGKKVVLVGSSYSASLVLKIAADETYLYHENIIGVASFSPGEYFENMELAPLLKTIKAPVFVTSSKKEIPQITEVTRNVPPAKLTHHKPKEASIHGSRALWETSSGSESCIAALNAFLGNL